MNLERMQALHDSVISNNHNISGSNDPKQIPNDATEGLMKTMSAEDTSMLQGLMKLADDTDKANQNQLLIQGAQAAAAGRLLGLEDDTTMKLLARKAQRGF